MVLVKVVDPADPRRGKVGEVIPTVPSTLRDPKAWWVVFEDEGVGDEYGAEQLQIVA